MHAIFRPSGSITSCHQKARFTQHTRRVVPLPGHFITRRSPILFIPNTWTHLPASLHLLAARCCLSPSRLLTLVCFPSSFVSSLPLVCVCETPTFFRFLASRPVPLFPPHCAFLPPFSHQSPLVFPTHGLFFAVLRTAQQSVNLCMLFVKQLRPHLPSADF